MSQRIEQRSKAGSLTFDFARTCARWGPIVVKAFGVKVD